MKGEFSIPPLRDLPPGRLAQRREHLLFEITRQRESRGALASLWPTRWQRPGRRRPLVLAAVALVVAVGTASAIGSVRDFILERGFIGLPPEGATPSAPETGELVLHYLGRSMTHASGDTAPLIQAWVYADGRIIWSRSEPPGGPSQVPARATELASGYLEQRLTPEGVELLRSEAAGLLDRNRTLLVPLPADYDPLWGPRPDPARARDVTLFSDSWPYGWGTVEARDGDRFVGLHWVGVDRWSRAEGPIATPKQRSDILRLDSLLTEPSSVLPASAWAVRKIRAYVPSHYRVCMDTSPPKDVSQLLALLPAPAADVLRAKGLKGSEHDLVEAREGGRTVVIGRAAVYCAKLTTEEAREVAEPFSGRDHDPRFSDVILGYRLATPAEPKASLDPTSIWFEPYFPHGQVTCSSCG